MYDGQKPHSTPPRGGHVGDLDAGKVLCDFLCPFLIGGWRGGREERGERGSGEGRGERGGGREGRGNEGGEGERE